MDDLTGGLTLEEYVRMTTAVLFEARNAAMASVGYGELALKELQISHPAFAHVSAAHKNAERTYAAVKGFDREFFQRKHEVARLKPNIPEAKD